jgi:hypothetical protein
MDTARLLFAGFAWRASMLREKMGTQNWRWQGWCSVADLGLRTVPWWSTRNPGSMQEVVKGERE